MNWRAISAAAAGLLVVGMWLLRRLTPMARMDPELRRRAAGLRRGATIIWASERYAEGPSAVVEPGDQGTYVLPDGSSPFQGLVVDFPATGMFCCSLRDVRLPEDV